LNPPVSPEQSGPPIPDNGLNRNSKQRCSFRMNLDL
jgi:hypothetical protein